MLNRGNIMLTDSGTVPWLMTELTNWSRVGKKLDNWVHEAGKAVRPVFFLFLETGSDIVQFSLKISY